MTFLENIKENVIKLKKIEETIEENKKEIKTNLDSIINLNKELIDKYINFSLLKKSIDSLINNDKTNINTEDIINSFLNESNKINEEFNKMENNHKSFLDQNQMKNKSKDSSWEQNLEENINKQKNKLLNLQTNTMEVKNDIIVKEVLIEENNFLEQVDSNE